MSERTLTVIEYQDGDEEARRVATDAARHIATDRSVLTVPRPVPDGAFEAAQAFGRVTTPPSELPADEPTVVG